MGGGGGEGEESGGKGTMATDSRTKPKMRSTCHADDALLPSATRQTDRSHCTSFAHGLHYGYRRPNIAENATNISFRQCMFSLCATPSSHTSLIACYLSPLVRYCLITVLTGNPLQASIQRARRRLQNNYTYVPGTSFPSRMWLA